MDTAERLQCVGLQRVDSVERIRHLKARYRDPGDEGWAETPLLEMTA